MMIYRMMTIQDWEKNKNKLVYEPVEIETDGFIHFSFKHQLVGVANSVHKEQDELIVLEVDSEKLSHLTSLKVEDLHHLGEAYPHLYNTLNFSAVVSTFKMIQTTNGFELVL